MDAIRLTWLCFGLFLGAAVLFDVRSYRLPNWLMLLGAATGLLLSGLFGGWQGAQSAALGLLGGIALLFIPWRFGVLGGGDVKFVGAIAAFVGWQGLADVLLLGAVAGGVVSLPYLLLPRGQEEKKQGWRARKIPYSIALATGGIGAVISGGFAGGGG